MNKDQKMRISMAAYYVASVCFILAGLLELTGGSMFGAAYLILGVALLSLGVIRNRRMNGTKNK